MDFASVEAAFKGAYGAFVNTDGITLGEQAELFARTPIFELAKQAEIKHYVWGNFDCAFKVSLYRFRSLSLADGPFLSQKSGYSMQYRAENYDGKGDVAEWLKTQASEKNSLTWSVLISGPYVDMLHFVSVHFCFCIAVLMLPWIAAAGDTTANLVGLTCNFVDEGTYGMRICTNIYRPSLPFISPADDFTGEVFVDNTANATCHVVFALEGLTWLGFINREYCICGTALFSPLTGPT
jgi:hypothetical protein